MRPRIAVMLKLTLAFARIFCRSVYFTIHNFPRRARFRRSIHARVVTYNSLLYIGCITEVEFLCPLTLNDIYTMHISSIAQRKCWDYRVLANLSASYPRLRGRFQGITELVRH